MPITVSREVEFTVKHNDWPIKFMQRGDRVFVTQVVHPSGGKRETLQIDIAICDFLQAAKVISAATGA